MDDVEPIEIRVLRWLAAHALSAAGMTVTLIAAAVAQISILSSEYGNGVLAVVTAVGVGTAAVAGARLLLRKPLRTWWLALPSAAFVVVFALPLVQRLR